MDFDGCNGGNTAHAFEHIGAIGQVTSASYPYYEEVFDYYFMNEIIDIIVMFKFLCIREDCNANLMLPM